MAIYDLTNATNSTNIADLALNLNTATGGMIGGFFVIVGFLIVLITMKAWNNTDAFAASTFGFMVISLLLWAQGLLGETILYTFILLSAVAGALLFKKR